MIMYYWVGVVEDRQDPLLSGRVRVRIHGCHNIDPVKLPTKDLPWAQTVLPVTSAGMNGIGEVLHGLVEGTTVVGFFADGEDSQIPVVIGSIAGFPLRKPAKKFGFRDPATTLSERPSPSEDFPRQSLINEPDVNRLARRQKISDTVVKKKRDNRKTGIPIAFSGSWDQPEIPYNPEYPYNHVKESESGHVEEIDDTKGNERLHRYHRSGTFEEIDANGTRVTTVIGDNFEIRERNSHLFIKGTGDITIEGTCNIYVKNNCNLQVDGNLKVHAHRDIEMKAGGDISMSAGGKIEMNARENWNVNSRQSILMRSLRGMTLTGTIKTTIASPITEVALLKINGLSITPIPPRPPIFTVPSIINTKNPSEPRFPALTLPSRKPEVALVVVKPVTESQPMT